MNLQSIKKLIPLRPRQLKAAVLISGLIGLELYRVLYAMGLDGRGLLKPGHPAWIGLILLSIAVGGLIFLSTAPLRGSKGWLPSSILAAVGCGLAAVSTVLTGLSGLAEGYLLYTIPALLAAAAFAGLAFCRLRGLKPHFLLHVLICIHFALQMLRLYQTNSFDPQVADYLFQLLACVALTVTAYQMAAMELGQGQRRWLWTAALAAVYLCAVSLGSSATWMYLTGGFWAFTAIPTARRPRPNT